MDKTEEQIMDELNKELKGQLTAGSLRMKVRIAPELGDENPFEEGTALAGGEKGAANLYGACSIEKFKCAGSLSYTHEDAAGWLSYVEKFNPRNFWYQDEGVKPWIYYEQYDSWLDTYGIDAVRAVYHSGHGGMDGNGKFYIPMGGEWGNFGCTVVTDPKLMGLGGGHPDEAGGTFGNEKIRYIFWSTCVSCRVLDGNTPARTWSQVHKGFRMLFGFETTSWDSGDYGKNFWEEWNKNSKPLSTAWLDASWRIAHDMAPSVAACGATRDEVVNRLNTERYLSPDPASGAWWAWRWYNVASVAREPNLALPQEPLVAKLQPATLS